MHKTESYWNNVAKEIEKRSSGLKIAGDFEPYYVYKREKFLKKLSTINFRDKVVLEFGSGPGGNLKEIEKLLPAKLIGCDISQVMIDHSRKELSTQVELIKVDGSNLPFPNEYVDVAFTSTVLQHVVDTTMLSELIQSICRVTKHDIYIFERIELRQRGNESNIGRTLQFYKTEFNKSGFVLREHEFIGTFWSRITAGIIRKLFSKAGRKEGEPESGIVFKVQSSLLKFTKLLDSLTPTYSGFCHCHFQKSKS